MLDLILTLLSRDQYPAPLYWYIDVVIKAIIELFFLLLLWAEWEELSPLEKFLIIFAILFGFDLD